MNKKFFKPFIEAKRLELWRAVVRERPDLTPTLVKHHSTYIDEALAKYTETLKALPSPKQPTNGTLFNLSAFPKLSRKERDRKTPGIIVIDKKAIRSIKSIHRAGTGRGQAGRKETANA